MPCVPKETICYSVNSPARIPLSHFLFRTLEYREELRTSYTRWRSRSEGGGAFTGLTEGESAAGAILDNQKEDPTAWNQYDANSEGTSNTWTESETESESESSVLIPVMGKAIP